MKCFNHADRAAAYRDSVPDSTVEGVNFNQAGYSIRYFCDECAEERRRNVGNTTRLEPLLPKCPTCGEIATYQTSDGTYWDSGAHYWRTGTPESLKCPSCHGEMTDNTAFYLCQRPNCRKAWRPISLATPTQWQEVALAGSLARTTES